MSAQPTDTRVYYALALDPIHVGAGGYRLGEVDLSIVREPGTNLPKIPGTSLEGCARAYNAIAAGSYSKPEFDTTTGELNEVKSCADKGGADGAGHCGEINCPVCVTYGFAIGPQNRSFQGMAQFYDARILFFPVHSLAGPVWVTSEQALADAGYSLPQKQSVSGHQVRTAAGLVKCPAQHGQQAAPQKRRWGLNLGWLFLDIAGDDLEVDTIWQKLPNMSSVDRLDTIKSRLVLVPDALFSLVVNSNLEARTSVSIDPRTGAAEDKALFTYEALPRATVLSFTVICQNPQNYAFPELAADGKRVTYKPFGNDQHAVWVRTNVESGLRLMEHLGVGGMGTRGFGRLRILNLAGGA